MDPYIDSNALDPDNPWFQQKIENLQLADEAYKKGHISLESLPVKITFQTTEYCNLRCPHCQLASVKKRRSMNPQFLQYLRTQLLPTLIELHPTNIGEPFMWPYFSQLCRDLRMYGVLLDLTTNGTLLTPKNIDCLAPIIRDIKISMDGATQKTYEFFRRGASFFKVLDNIRLLVQKLRKIRIRKPIISLQMTLMRDNVGELPELIKLAAQLGIDKVKAYHMFSFRPELDEQSLLHYLEYYENIIIPEALSLGEEFNIQLELAEPSGGSTENLERRICFLPWFESWIDVDGAVYSCHSHRGKKAGFIDDFAGAWNGDLYRSIRKNLLHPTPFSACYQCGMNYKKPFEMVAVPFDKNNFIAHSATSSEEVTWSSRMRQFDLRGIR